MFDRGGPLAIRRLRDEMDRLFSGFTDDFGLPRLGPTGWAGGSGFPGVNVWEDEGNLFLEAEVPGLRMEDLEIYVVGNEITLRGERKEEPESGKTFHRRERSFGAFSRVLRLPVEVDADKVEATLHDGVLKLTLPKVEAARPRKIEVKSSTQGARGTQTVKTTSR